MKVSKTTTTAAIAVAIASASTAIPSSSAFVAPIPPTTTTNGQHANIFVPLSMTSTGFPNNDNKSVTSTSASSSLSSRSKSSLPTQKGKKMSEAIPFLECPKVLKESDLAGNFGFDPIGFAKNKEQLWEMREAEVKHARLAMLAAVGWPVSELMDRSIADFFDAPALLDDGDRVPTILNGGLGKVPPQWWGFCIGLCAAIDMYGVAKARRGDPEYFPGNLGFDPLNIYPASRDGQARLQLAEIKHGRTAMMGVLGYVIEEYSTKMAVVDDTPILFQPITETMEEVIVGVL